MSSLATTTFVLAPTGDRYLSLAGEEYLRKLSIGNNWSVLRIGAMWAVTPDGTNNLATCALQLGVCTADATFANTAGFSAASTTNYIGELLSDSGGAGSPGTLTYTANSGNPYFTSTFAGAIRRVATTTTNNVPASTSHIIPSNTGSTQRRGLMYIDITKGSPNYTTKPYFTTAAQGGSRDFSYAHFLSGLETSGTPVCDAVTLTTATAATIACSESAGNFDTVSVWWNRASFPLHLYALAVRRVS